MTPLRARAALAALLPCLAAACGDESTPRLTEAAATAGVKFYNLGVNAPGVNFYAGDAKVTGANSVACTPLPAPPADSTCRSRGVENAAGTAFGAAAAGGFYVSLAPGQYTFTGRISAATADNGVAIATVPLTLADGDRYSVFLTGPYNAATKQVDTFVLKDEIPTALPPDTTHVRVVSTVANARPLVLVIRTQTSPVVEFTLPAVAYKTAGSWIPLPINGLVDLFAREEGSTAALRSLATGVTLTARRVYTVAIRGDNTVTSTTAANRLQATTAPNR